MRPTRVEMINELRHLLGHTEETELLIDCILDAWETYDLLLTRVGQGCASTIMNAVESHLGVITLYDLPPYVPPCEHTNYALLN